MDCPIKTGEGTGLFVSYGARKLPPAAIAAFEEHLQVCSDCRRVAAAQESVWSALENWEPQPISTNFDQKLYARIAAEDQRPWYRRLLAREWSFRPAMPVAAACATVIAAFLLKGPIAERPAGVTLDQSKIDIEQVERALDDLDMLKQLGVVAPPSKQPSLSHSM